MIWKSAVWRLSTAVLVSLLLPTSLSATALFKPAQSYSSGSYAAFSIAVADLNGDGKPDLAVANQICFDCAGVGVGVLLGNGDGTFQPAQTYDSGGEGAVGVAVADVNGDGKPDLIVYNLGGTIGVLLGNGDGTFQPVQSFNAGASGFSIAVADVNADGKPDVVVVDESVTGGVAVLLGNGDGTFQAPTLYGSGGAFASSIAIADVNGDGKPDLLVANQGVQQEAGTLCVLLGNGDGTFQAAHAYNAGGLGTLGIAVADVNLDGKLDVLVANEGQIGDPGTGAAGVLLGNGDGTFQAVKIFSSGGYLTTSIAVADANLDGKPDLILTNWGKNSSEVGVLLGNGDGTFQRARISGTGGSMPNAIAAADVIGDGTIDLLVTNEDGGEGGTGAVGVLLSKVTFPSATGLACSPNPSVAGQPVMLTATVTSTGPLTPTGKVRFMNGATAIGASALKGGVATLTTAKLPVGTLSLTAVYSGDMESSKSTSPVIVQVVNSATRDR